MAPQDSPENAADTIAAARRPRKLVLAGLLGASLLAAAGAGVYSYLTQEEPLIARPPPPPPMAADRCIETIVAGAPRCLKPGDTFRDCDACPEMVVIPAGRFRMGSPKDEPERGPREGPLREVTIPRHLAIARYEVSFDEWEACLADGGCERYRPDDIGWGRGKQPVIHISWHDAHTYNDWMTKKSGQRYRLPSEAEWEYAARGGTTTAYWWGNRITPDDANYKWSESWNGSPTRRFTNTMLPVASHKPNPFGLYNVHGNAREWVEDCLHETYRNAPIDGSAWGAENRGDCTRRMLRSGNYVSHPKRIRSAFRLGLKPEFRIEATGLRPVRDLTEIRAGQPAR
jgi:formylglycine-generating enzyme required for sulfatase activity